jgi:hypothetical protein
MCRMRVLVGAAVAMLVALSAAASSHAAQIAHTQDCGTVILPAGQPVYATLFTTEVSCTEGRMLVQRAWSGRPTPGYTCSDLGANGQMLRCVDGAKVSTAANMHYPKPKAAPRSQTRNCAAFSISGPTGRLLDRTTISSVTATRMSCGAVKALFAGAYGSADGVGAAPVVSWADGAAHPRGWSCTTQTIYSLQDTDPGTLDLLAGEVDRCVMKDKAFRFLSGHRTRWAYAG